MRRTPDRIALLDALSAKPYAFDFFQALRRLECAYDVNPRIGTAVKLTDEPVRLGQEPALEFAPAALQRCERLGANGAPKLYTRFFGLFGPNGALPLHLTEYARNPLTAVPEKYAKERPAGYRTRPSAAPFAAFADIFHHRFLSLLYRAWAQAQPTVNLDRPSSDRFADHVGAFIGMQSAALRDRDEVPDRAKLFFSGHLARQTKNADGLVAVLSGFFRVPVQVEQFVGHWMPLSSRERTQLGRGGMGSTLAKGAVVGARVWDRQYKIRITLGALTRAQYESFLPSGRNFHTLRDWGRTYMCLELAWDVRLVLRSDAVPALRLGQSAKLGWSTWLGQRHTRLDATELILDCETGAARHSRAPKQINQPSLYEMKAAA